MQKCGLKFNALRNILFSKATTIYVNDVSSCDVKIYLFSKTDTKRFKTNLASIVHSSILMAQIDYLRNSNQSYKWPNPFRFRFRCNHLFGAVRPLFRCIIHVDRIVTAETRTKPQSRVSPDLRVFGWRVCKWSNKLRPVFREASSTHTLVSNRIIVSGVRGTCRRNGPAVRGGHDMCWSGFAWKCFTLCAWAVCGGKTTCSSTRTSGCCGRSKADAKPRSRCRCERWAMWAWASRRMVECSVRTWRSDGFIRDRRISR